MKHCMYCNTLMAQDAVYCPKCGRKQSTFVKSSNNKPSINITAEPPVEFSNKLNRDIYSLPISEYKKKMGFSDNTNNAVYATIGSTYLHGLAGEMMFGFIGNMVGQASVGKLILSIEKQGILLMGLNPINLHFNGKNKFISNKNIQDAYKVGSDIHLVINHNDIAIKIPHIFSGVQPQNRKHVFNLIVQKYEDATSNKQPQEHNFIMDEKPDSKMPEKDESISGSLLVAMLVLASVIILIFVLAYK